MKKLTLFFMLCCAVGALVFPAQTLAQLSAEICIWDANGGGCEAFPYQSDCLCDHGYEHPAGDKTTTVDISATSIVSMEFQLFYTTCQAGGNWEFLLNGTVIGTAENLDNNTCSCTPQELTWPHVVTITDVGVLNGAWNFGASNQITVSFVGHDNEVPAWYSVTVSYEEKVHASFTPTSQTVALGTAASFDASSSYVDEGSIVSYGWDFGDGATGTGVTVSHTYSSEGCYNVVLAVTDNIGRTGFAGGTACAAGALPTADAGGPYTVAELIPLTFDGSGSFDAEGIVSYEWDFGDGTSGEGVSPSHAYATPGERTVTLTVYDAAGQSNTDSTTVSVANAPPRVISVPWIENGESAPHSTWDGKEISLKGTVKDPAPVSYVWDFGDGTSESGTVTDPYVIEARHTYTGSVGTLFIATLTVTDSSGLIGQDTYTLEIKADEHQTRVDAAIDEGLWYLHKSMIRYSQDGQDFGRWLDWYNASTSASAIHAFEDKSHLPDGDLMEDPYVETVRRGINNMLSYMYPITVTNGFDRNGNGYLLGCNDGHAIYEPGMVMMALVASENRYRVATAGDPDYVQGRTYGDIIEDMVEYLAYAQNDNPPNNSGWRYNPNDLSSDNSVTQWPVLGLQSAERWDIIAPEPVKDYLLQWLGYSQNTNGGFGYTGPDEWVNISKTGAGIIGLFYCGLGLDDAPAVNAFNYINTNWGSDGEFWSGYPSGTAMLYGFYSVFKAGMSWDPIIDSDLFLAEHAAMIPDHVWWWNELSAKLVEDQDASGGWLNTSQTSGETMTTAWAVQILAKALHRKYPAADANGPYEGDVDIPVCLDGSGSYHNDPYRNIVLYEWDCDNDGTYDVSCTDPTECCCTYSSYGPYTARLRVTDDGSPTYLRDTDTATVDIHPPPHPPTAVCGGPYAGWIGEPVTFDCSGSFDINEGDYITLCEWDLDNDGDVDCTDPPGPCTYTWNAPYEGVVSLTVTDTTGRTDTCWTTVSIGNHAPVAIPGGPYSGCVDEPITIDGSESHDIDPGDSITCSWDLDGDREFDDCFECICKWTWSSPGNHDVGLQVTDSFGEKNTEWTTASIYPCANLPPTADPNGPYLGPLESCFDGSGSSDPDGDALTYSWDFGDGNTGSDVTPCNIYAEAGIYDVCLTVNDGTVDSEEVCTSAVVYDPSAGFVTGGGWIDSPEGAYKPDTSLTGKANFGFVSKYKKGATAPTGQTEFQFQTAGLNFHSDSYEWLVVTGANVAKFKGEGTINGENDENGNAYKFMLWAGDGSPDTFRIRIWSEDDEGNETAIYDNGFEQEISGGQIVIHVKK